MIEITIRELKKFIDAAKPIRDTRALPIYAYVKLVCAGNRSTFYKTNGHSFAVCVVDASFKKDITLLIEEKTLFGFASFSRGDSIKIKKKDNSIILDDGFRTVSCQSVEDHYPVIQPKESEELFLLDVEVLAALFLAKNHTSLVVDRSMRPWTCFVHMVNIGKKGYVAGLNGHISYFRSFSQKLPEVSLDPEMVGIIAKMASVFYSRQGNYDYFDCGNVSYGFIKSETACPDLSKVLEKFKSEKFVTVDRRPMVDFCEMVLDINSSAVAPEISIDASGKEGIELNFVDISENQKASELLEAENDSPFNKIILQPKLFQTVLKDLGVDKVRLVNIMGNLVVSSTEDENYLGSIMELAPLKAN